MSDFDNTNSPAGRSHPTFPVTRAELHLENMVLSVPGFYDKSRQTRIRLIYDFLTNDKQFLRLLENEQIAREHAAVRLMDQRARNLGYLDGIPSDEDRPVLTEKELGQKWANQDVSAFEQRVNAIHNEPFGLGKLWGMGGLSVNTLGGMAADFFKGNFLGWQHPFAIANGTLREKERAIAAMLYLPFLDIVRIEGLQ